MEETGQRWLVGLGILVMVLMAIPVGGALFWRGSLHEYQRQRIMVFLGSARRSPSFGTSPPTLPSD